MTKKLPTGFIVKLVDFVSERRSKLLVSAPLSSIIRVDPFQLIERTVHTPDACSNAKQRECSSRLWVKAFSVHSVIQNPIRDRAIDYAISINRSRFWLLGQYSWESKRVDSGCICRLNLCQHLYRLARCNRTPQLSRSWVSGYSLGTKDFESGRPKRGAI